MAFLATLVAPRGLAFAQQRTKLARLGFLGPAPAANTNANAPANTTGTVAANRTAADTHRSYPDHAMLNMTKDQLKAAPEFKYAR